MKTRIHQLLSSGLFSAIVLLFLGTSQNVFSQTTVTLTTADNGNTVTIPANATNVTVEVWGAGGSGAGGDKGNFLASGGGGGAYSRSINISPGTYSFLVGVGASSSPTATAGTAGGNTYFINAGTVYAEGGSGGPIDGTGGTGGNAANGIGNDVTLSGVDGGAGVIGTGGDGGDGANSVGSGGAGGTSTDGSPGSPPGGGGGAGGGKNFVGGAGGDGQIIITYTVGAACNLASSGLINIDCDPNGTPAIPGDDTFTFDLNPTGTDLGTTYTVSGDVSQAGVSYGSATNFGPYPISGGNLSITITDDTDGSCQFIETVPAPAPCSVPICTLTGSGLSNIQCDDAGTAGDSADDTFSFDLNPAGTDLGATYNIGGDVTQSGISYGNTNIGPFPISGGDLNITITDVSTNCSFGPFNAPAPAPCSNGCNLVSVGLSGIICDNMTTSFDASDDEFSFNLNPTGINLGSTYSVSGSFTQSGLPYGTNSTFSGFLITAGDLTLTITDDSDGSCQIVAFIVPAPSECSLNHASTQCSSCHLKHNAPGMALTNFAGNSLLCQSCHQSGGSASAKPLVEADKGTTSHWWDALALNPSMEVGLPLDPDMSLRTPLVDGELGTEQIICSTCHNQHNNGAKGDPYLRMDNTGDAMCKDCHRTRDVQRYQDGATNKGSHPVGIVYNGASSKLNASPTNTQTVGGNVECSSCHGTHDIGGSLGLAANGNLLRTTNDVNLCLDCHNYPEHNGFSCLDCHEVHNTVDGTIDNNIFMIKNVVNGSPVTFLAQSGPNSFVDTNGAPHNGICEVCHTTTTHHTSDGGNTTHDDASDKREQNCAGCHFHNAGFETPSGPQTCVSCHSSAQSGARGGVVQIVGAGSEFDNNYPSRHTASGIGVAPDNAECEACHFDSGASHPTSTMSLRDPDAATVFPGSDTDVYCIQCHDGDAPTSPMDFSYINTATYNKSSYITSPHDTGINGGTDTCLSCHERHGSPYTALTMQATNYENCFACHDGGVASTTISEADRANPGTSSGNQHAFNVSASSGNYESNAPTDPAVTARLDAGNIVCSTCHNPHDNANGKLLVSPNSADEMCKDCHNARDLGRYTDDIVNNKGSHPVGLTYVAGGNYVDPAPTLSSTQVGLVNGNIECSSCHSTHNATTTDGNLLRETMGDAACKECHDYKAHQGFECLDCHQTHNNGTNIMLIKDNIDIDLTAGVDLWPVVFNSQGTNATPVQSSLNSFADGDEDGNGTYDGICEVCHTSNSKTYHYNTSAGDHTHNTGTNCVTCHPHRAADDYLPIANTSFPNGTCHGCHEDPTPGNQEYPLTGAHDKHSGLLYGYTCSQCHFGLNDASPGHNNGTPDVIFDPTGLASRFGNDTPTPTWNSGAKTCDNIYCHSSGSTADRGVVGDAYPELMTYTTTPAWDAAPGSIATCTPCHGGKGNMTAPYTITTSSPPEHLISDYNGVETPTSGLHTHDAMFNDSNDCTNGPTGAGAVQCYLCHNTNGASCDGTNYQGTYGSPLKVHVDGQTYYENDFQSNGGTWAPWQGNGKTIDNHCASKGNW